MITWILPLLSAALLFLKIKHLDQKILNLAWVTVLLISIGSIYTPQIYSFILTDHQYLRPWNGFHYYLGSKYYQQLDYYHLYNCTIEADRQTYSYWKNLPLVRNLNTYQTSTPHQLPNCPRDSFPTATWNQFISDTHFWHTTPQEFWQELFLDKGYNPTPAWTMIGGSLTSLINLENIIGIKLLVLSEWAIIITGLWYLTKSSGTQPILVMASWIILYFGTYHRLLGNFGQYWWLGLLIWSWGLWNQKKYYLSGISIGTSIMLRIFPIFFLLPVLLKFIIKRNSVYKNYLLGSFTSITTLSLLTLYHPGFPAWKNFITNISLHSKFINQELLHIGLSNLLHTYNFYQPWLYWVICLLWTIIWIKIALKTNHNHLPIIGGLLLYPWLSLSPYYYLALCGLILICYKNKSQLQHWIIFTWFIIFSIFSYLGITDQLFNRQAPLLLHTISETAIALLMFTWLITLSNQPRKNS